MPTLTPEDLHYIRLMSGDDCTPYEVSDDDIQYLYDNKASAAPLCMSGDSLGGTIVWVLRARLRRAVKLFDESNIDGQNKTISQKYDHLKEQLAAAEAACGMSSGGLVTWTAISTRMDLPVLWWQNPGAYYAWWYEVTA